MTVARNRPLGITIFGILSILIGILRLPSVFNSIDSGNLITGSVFLIFSILTTGVGIGFLEGRRWAWYLAFASYLLTVSASIVAVILGNVVGVFTVIIPGFMIAYLWSPKVQLHFGVNESTTSGSVTGVRLPDNPHQENVENKVFVPKLSLSHDIFECSGCGTSVTESAKFCPNCKNNFK